jgi:ABC-2 type transport system ATP-binding protein
VLSATAFGSAIHVSGTNRKLLEEALRSWRGKGIEWAEARPTLEDVFIQLMAGRPDDRYAA